MVNKLVNNTYILDTSSGNTPIPWYPPGKIQAIAFWSTNTTGLMQITAGDTTQVLIQLANPINAPNTVGIYLGGFYFTNTMKLPTLTVGTAWVYLV